MSRHRAGKLRIAAAVLVLAIGVIAGLAGPTAGAAGPKGCTAVSTSTSSSKFCDFKSKTGLVEIIGAGQAWGVSVVSPYYDECTSDGLGAEVTTCYVGSGRTVEAVAYPLAFVTVRDIPFP